MFALGVSITMVLLAVAIALAAPARADVYWTNFGDSLGRASTSGSHETEHFIHGAALPCGVAIGGGYVYWLNSDDATIGRARLDGTDVDQSLISFPSLTGTPCGLAVDARHVYWADTGDSTIGRANLDGSEVDDDFIQELSGLSPCGVAVNAQHIFWANSGADTIGRANIDGNDVNQNFIRLAGKNVQPSGVAVGDGRIYWTTLGNNLGRADLDGTRVRKFARAHSPTGVAVAGASRP